jgi:nitrite reductase/ring-hydroxylating ferredoxin subunit
MAAAERVICASSALAEAGNGVRFEVAWAGETVPAFVVRYAGAPRAYLNRCAHVPMELDWNPGKFFDFSQTLLVCSTHGAAYDPLTGHCIGGPCRGARLTRLPVTERDGMVLLGADPPSS